MDEKLQAAANAPLNDPRRILKINGDPLNINGGKPFSAPREKRENHAGQPGHLTTAELKARRAKAEADKLEKLFDYYATTDKDAETVARHMGLYVKVQNGTDEETGKPTFERVLDVGRAAQQLKWRRDKAAAGA